MYGMYVQSCSRWMILPRPHVNIAAHFAACPLATKENPSPPRISASLLPTPTVSSGHQRDACAEPNLHISTFIEISCVSVAGQTQLSPIYRDQEFSVFRDYCRGWARESLPIRWMIANLLKSRCSTPPYIGDVASAKIAPIG